MADESKLVKAFQYYQTTGIRLSNAQEAEYESHQATIRAHDLDMTARSNLKGLVAKLPGARARIQIGGVHHLLSVSCGGVLDVVKQPFLGVADSPADHSPDAGEKVEP